MPRHSTSLTQEQDSMNIDRVQLDTTLAKIVDPHTGQNVLSAKNIRHLQVDGGRVLIDFTLPYPARDHRACRAEWHEAAAEYKKYDCGCQRQGRGREEHGCSESCARAVGRGGAHRFARRRYLWPVPASDAGRCRAAGIQRWENNGTAARIRPTD